MKEFTTVNGKTAIKLNERKFNGHVIEKVNRQGYEFYTVDKCGMFLYLKDAKESVK